MMQRTRMALVVAAALGVAVPVAAQQPAQSIDDLLKRVQQGEVTEKRENREREQRFQQDKASQQKVLPMHKPSARLSNSAAMPWRRNSRRMS